MVSIKETIQRLRFGRSKPTSLEEQRQMSIRGSAFTRATGSGLARPGTTSTQRKLIAQTSSALVPAIPGGGSVGAVKSLSSRARGLYERTLGNPLAGGGIKGFLGRAFGRTVGGASIAAGAALTESAITGEDPRISPRRLAFGALGFGVGGIPGAITGTVLGVGSRVKEGVQNIQLPNFPSPYNIGSGLGTGIGSAIAGAKDFAQGLGSTIGFPGSVSASYGPTVAPSVNVGGGGLDPSMIALLVALAGGGGYLLGKKRKRRKKRKSKKGKRSRK